MYRLWFWSFVFKPSIIGPTVIKHNARLVCIYITQNETAIQKPQSDITGYNSWAYMQLSSAATKASYYFFLDTL